MDPDDDVSLIRLWSYTPCSSAPFPPAAPRQKACDIIRFALCSVHKRSEDINEVFQGYADVANTDAAADEPASSEAPPAGSNVAAYGSASHDESIDASEKPTCYCR